MPHGDSTHSQSTQEQSTQGESVQATGTTPLRGGRARALPALLAAAPWWVVLAAGLVCVWLGFGLAVKPLSSLAALTFYVGASFIASGIVDLIDRERAAAPATRMVLGWGWIASGIVVLAWSGATMALLPLMVAISLIVSGLVRGIDSFRGTGTPADGRMATLVFALADLILGVVSLAWPDVTLLLLAFLFGVRTVIFGLGSIWSALVQARSGSPTAVRRRPTVLRHWTRLAGAVLSLVLAVAAAGIGVQLRDGAPQLSDFYTAPETLPAHAGALLKSEPFTTAVPAGTKAWRILYTTTRADSTPTVASAVVLTSLTPATGPRPVITWAHGTTGYAPACAPSNLAEPFTSGALPALDEIVDNGWVLVTTDYTGMGTQGPQPYLIGQGEARSVLDSVRAAKALDAEQAELDMAEGTVVWGHSQGGQAELWTGGIAASYAPDVKISGVVAMAPASDAIGLVENLPAIAGGSVFASYVAAAYAATYPDVSFNDYIAPTARTFVREMSTRCLTEPGVLVSLISAIAIDKNKTIFSKDPTQGALGERLRENTPVLPIPFALFIAQEESDTLVIPPVQDAYVAARCVDGQELEYRKYAEKDHMGLVSEGSPLLGDLIAWTKDRIAGKPAADTCNDLN
ncbi:lipase family protein [Arthrobacter sp.]|uniref:lipase family protein n=1 Tax=Arthrobacter sp. TaxID=1667 RepID=UPI0026E0431E|nr:lipase family protein [Arthrobacter sp.]MDO5754027.1 lipase family protein [Arthrobacter sp.]